MDHISLLGKFYAKRDGVRNKPTKLYFQSFLKNINIDCLQTATNQPKWTAEHGYIVDVEQQFLA